MCLDSHRERILKRPFGPLSPRRPSMLIYTNCNIYSPEILIKPPPLPILQLTYSRGQLIERPFNLPTHMSLGRGRKPEHREVSHAVTGRTCRLHTGSTQGQGWKQVSGIARPVGHFCTTPGHFGPDVWNHFAWVDNQPLLLKTQWWDKQRSSQINPNPWLKHSVSLKIGEILGGGEKRTFSWIQLLFHCVSYKNRTAQMVLTSGEEMVYRDNSRPTACTSFQLPDD